MAKQGRVIHVTYQKQIQELLAQGKSIRKIAESLQIARNTVKKYAGLHAHETETAPSCPAWASGLNWGEIEQRFQSGIQIKQLHAEYAPGMISLSTFYRRFKTMRQSSLKPTIPMNHKPGERAQIDYCDGIDIIDPVTCKIQKTQLFVGVLPFSSYCYAEFSFNQKQISFLHSHENMWRYFGGVTPYVVIDNLKSGVSKAHIYDPERNQTYCDFGNHYGFAVLPARPRRPRDKGVVEATVQALQKSFYQKHNRHTFTSLGELNSSLRQFLKTFNNRIMKDYGVSRWQRFEQEKDLLLALPKDRYDLKEWSLAKVHPDCHIQVKHCFYSVPFQRVGQQVRVRISTALIEIFDLEGNALAAHSRPSGRGKRVTVDAHFPEERLQASRFEIKQAKAKAAAIGPKTQELMDILFGGPRPLVNLRKAQGLLRFFGKDGIDNDAMEYAASQCITFQKFRLSFYRDCATSFAQQRFRSKRQAPRRDNSSLCLQYTKQSSQKD